MTDAEHRGDPRAQPQRQYHIGLAAGEVAPAIVLVGDPARAERVAERFERVELERCCREYRSYTGVHRGLRMTVMATGMGADNTEIAVVELCQLVAAPTMIRCGSSGGLDPSLALGDLVIASAAYRLESTSLQYVGEGYPATAHPEVLLSLVQAAEELGHPHRVGITATASGFYGAQARQVPGFPNRHPSLVDDLARQGVLNLEMETSCLFTLASLRGFRAGAVCAVYADRHHGRFVDAVQKHAAEGRCIDTALRALHLAEERLRERGGSALWHPGRGGSGR